MFISVVTAYYIPYFILSFDFSYADDIDLFAGGLSESPRGGSLLGPTFTCLFIKQFRKIRISDRMFYERPGVFTEG